MHGDAALAQQPHVLAHSSVAEAAVADQLRGGTRTASAEQSSEDPRQVVTGGRHCDYGGLVVIPPPVVVEV